MKTATIHNLRTRLAEDRAGYVRRQIPYGMH